MVNMGYSVGSWNSTNGLYAEAVGWSKDEAVSRQAVIQTISSTGSAIGALFSGKLLRLGSLKCLIITNIVVIIGCALTVLDFYVNTYVLLLLGRFLFGAAAGSFSVFCTKYISQTAPTKLRGPSGACCQCGLTFGILIPFSIGILESFYSKPKYDPIYLIALLVFPIFLSSLQIFMLLCFYRYDTPYELQRNGHK